MNEKLDQMFEALAKEIANVSDKVVCSDYDKDCNGCPLMMLQNKWLNWQGQCIGELLLGEE